MGTFESLEEAREFFKGDTFAAVNGMRIDELNEEGCVCSMDIRDDHRNALGGVMGGVIFTLGDFTFAVACNNVHKPTVALDVTINFLNASKGNRLIARSKCLKSGKTTGVFQISISDDQGKDIALFTGTGFKL